MDSRRCSIRVGIGNGDSNRIHAIIESFFDETSRVQPTPDFVAATVASESCSQWPIQSCEINRLVNYF